MTRGYIDCSHYCESCDMGKIPSYRDSLQPHPPPRALQLYRRKGLHPPGYTVRYRVRLQDKKDTLQYCS